VGSRNGNNEGFDIEEFLFGEGSCPSTGKADVGNLVQLSHFLLGEKIEGVDIFLWEEGFEMFVTFSKGNEENKAGCNGRISLKKVGEGFIEGTGTLRASHYEDCRIPFFDKVRSDGGCISFLFSRTPLISLRKGNYIITQNLSNRDGRRKYVVKAGEDLGSIARSNTIDKSRMDIAFVDNKVETKNVGGKDNRKSNITSFTEYYINMITVKISKRLKKSDEK
jgi:hypothetical protein